MPDAPRKIIHLDMDAFYASIEQRDDPGRYAGQPIAVGGGPPRGVVMTASYEARPYGIHSAQPSAEAARRCPELIFVPPRMDAYKAESRAIRQILRHYTDLIEPVSLDEAYLDVTTPKQGPPSGTLIAEEIRAAIRTERDLTASAGVAANKFVAKVASDWDKPDGCTVVRPDEMQAFIAQLPIEAFRGVGPVTAEAMQAMGLHTGADLQQVAERDLVRRFGKRGRWFAAMARGEDARPVRPNRKRKSVGAERTFSTAIADTDQMLRRLEPMAERVAQRLRRAGRKGRTVTLKMKTRHHEVLTRQTTLQRPVASADVLMQWAERLLSEPHPPEEPLRLLGLTVSSLITEDAAGTQLELAFS